MVWFKVDDGFPRHPKVLRIPREDNLRALAIGTWTLCGAWSASNRLDGYVPTYAIDEAGGTIAGAEALVVVKLWRKVRDGYRFVNWAEWQPTRAELDEKKENERVRKANQRAARKASGGAAVSADVPAGHIAGPTTSRPVPSRPDPSPSRPDDDQSSRGNSRALSTAGDDPVHNRLYAKIVEVCAEHGVTLHPLVVPDVIEFIEKRRGPGAKPIQAVERYFPGAIKSSWPEVEQFIYEKGLAS